MHQISRTQSAAGIAGAGASEGVRMNGIYQVCRAPNQILRNVKIVKLEWKACFDCVEKIQNFVKIISKENSDKEWPETGTIDSKEVL